MPCCAIDKCGLKSQCCTGGCTNATIYPSPSPSSNIPASLLPSPSPSPLTILSPSSTHSAPLLPIAGAILILLIISLITLLTVGCHARQTSFTVIVKENEDIDKVLEQEMIFIPVSRDDRVSDSLFIIQNCNLYKCIHVILINLCLDKDIIYNFYLFSGSLVSYPLFSSVSLPPSYCNLGSRKCLLHDNFTGED